MFFVYGSVAASIVLYVNTIALLKKLRKEEDTALNTITGSITLAFIVYSVFVLCGR